MDKNNSIYARHVTSGRFELHQKKPYQVPALTFYGSVRHLTQGTGTHNGDGGNKKVNPTSDPRVKENVVQIGVHPLGIGIYLFDYKASHRDRYGEGRQFGVMADEVETVMPAAVGVTPDGYKTVNYAMIGISHNNH